MFETITFYCVTEDCNLRNTSLCWQYNENISSRFSINSEASASVLIENIKEMFPWY